MKYISLFALLLCFCSYANAADSSRDLKLILGTSAFLDEDIPFDHFIVGASIRLGLTKKVSIEPQFLYMKGPGSDRDYILTGNISYDLATGPWYEAYAVGGGGLIHHTERFQSGGFSVNSWTANGGVGIRFFITERFFVAPEFRFGLEPLLSTQVGIGYSF